MKFSINVGVVLSLAVAVSFFDRAYAIETPAARCHVVAFRSVVGSNAPFFMSCTSRQPVPAVVSAEHAAGAWAATGGASK